MAWGELTAASRTSNFDRASGPDPQELYGMTFVFRDEHTAVELGARGGRFDLERSDPLADDESTYVEVHCGMRCYPLDVSAPIQPFLGAGLMWSDGHPDDDRDSNDIDPSVHSRDYREDSDWSLYAWAVANAGLYAQVGVDVPLGPLVLSGGVRALCADDVDLFARHNDDFAVELYFALGFMPH